MGKKKSYTFSTAVFIGRFQPFHKGHLHSVCFALEHAAKLIIVIGGHRLAPSVRGPWSSEQRIDMILSCLTPAQKKRIRFVTVRDRLYSEDMWVSNVIGEVSKIAEDSAIALVGHEKDASSYYLRSFPNWVFLETGNYKGINSTDFRNSFFLTSVNHIDYSNISFKVANALKKYRKTPDFKELQKKYKYVESAIRFPKKTFTPDIVCNSLLLTSRYILLVKNQDTLSKNLYSLPECELDQHDNAENCSLKNLAQTTKFDILSVNLKKYIKKSHTFQYAERFPVKTQQAVVFFYKLDLDVLPKVSSNKKMSSVEWVLLDDLFLIEDKFYADHFQIIQYFLGL